MEREENMRTHFTSFREISRLHLVFTNIRSKQSVICTQTAMNEHIQFWFVSLYNLIIA